MIDPESEADPLAALAEEFAERFRRGERPSLLEYTARYPEHADRIRRLFPALVQMEQLGSVGGHVARNYTPPGAGLERVPPQLGEYRILREVARGGMGVVYEAVQETLGRHVALKVLPAASRMSPTDLERFRREARAAARLHHTNIVPIFGVGEHDGVHYFAMQFIRGQSLDRVLHELRALRRLDPPAVEPDTRVGSELKAEIVQGLLSGRFSDRGIEDVCCNGATPTLASQSTPSAASLSGRNSIVLGDRSGLGEQSTLAYSRSVARVGVQVADALAYSHQQGILHRDIKPANLLLDTQGTVWVSDFGLVKEQGTEELTTQGDFVGTLRYMAPERFEGKSDPRSDVYGLGLTLYEMLALRPAFAASDRARLVEHVRHDEPPRPRKLNPQIPRDLETIVLKAIAKEPGRRYASATAMAEDLRRFLADRPVEARRVAAWERAWRSIRRNPWLAGSTAAAAVLLVVVAVGSVVAAARLGTELQARTGAQTAERDAKRDALDKLWRSHLARAQAGRFSRRFGQRLDSLAAIEEAARIARSLRVSDESFDSLRNEAIACLALPDLRPGKTSVALPSGPFAIVFDDTLGRYALSDASGTIGVCRVGEDRSVVRLLGLGALPESLLFSPDGRFLAARASGRVQAWATDGGYPIFQEPLPALVLGGFSPDGTQIIAVQPDGSIGAWDVTTERQVRRISTGITPKLVALHPEGRKLAVGYGVRADVVEIWDINSVNKVTERATAGAGPVCALAWHPDGRRLAIAFEGSTGRVQVWDTVQGTVRATIEGHAQGVFAMAFHPDGNLLLTAAEDATGRLWDAATGRPLVNWPGGIGINRFSRDATMCGFVVLEGTARPMEVAEGREYQTLVSSLGAGRGAYRQGAIDASGLLAVGMGDGTRLWDLASGHELAFLPTALTDSVNFVTGPDGRELLTCGADGLRRWPIRDVPEAPGRVRIGPPRDVRLPFVPVRADVSGDGRTVAVASERSSQAVVLDLAMEAVVCTLAPHPAVSFVALSPDGQWAATSGWHARDVKLWDARSGTMVEELPLGPMSTAFFAPDSRTLVTSRGDEYRFWDVPTWQPTRRMPWEISSYPGWVAFSPDRALVALELSPAVIHLVDAASGRTVAKLEDPRSDRAQWLGFTPDGGRLVAICAYAKAIHVWDLSAIRRQLAAVHLDWASPPYPPERKDTSQGPRTVEVLLGAMPSAERVREDQARSLIESFRHAVESSPNSAKACNNLAWIYATAPKPLRDLGRALSLAQKASELDPRDPMIRNTLGVAYYRTGRYHEAADTLRANLPYENDSALVVDLYFLAMSYHQLGERELARAYYTWAQRAARTATEPGEAGVDELDEFRAEAESLLGN